MNKMDFLTTGTGARDDGGHWPIAVVSGQAGSHHAAKAAPSPPRRASASIALTVTFPWKVLTRVYTQAVTVTAAAARRSDRPRRRT